MKNSRIFAGMLVVLGILLGLFLYISETNPESRLSAFAFKLGLDLQGGTQLIYKADVSSLEEGDVSESMDALRDVIERRVNLFGVSEPLVQLEETGIFSDEGGEQRLIVELPGVTDVDEAIELIGQTPLLEFKLQNNDVDLNNLEIEPTIDEDGVASIDGSSFDNLFIDTGLTGKYLQKSTLQFQQGGGFGQSIPVVSLDFTKEGSELFAQITRENVGEVLAIFLDGAPITLPVIQTEITTGEAVISGNFTADEARELVGRLNAGALPVPIELLSTQNVGATLGSNALNQGLKAGVIGLIIVAIFLVFWYRAPGLLSVLALSLYVLIVLSIFKVFGVTLTAAGIAGFIISVGMAVDANILIFERIKEEFARGKDYSLSVEEGFSRAWPSIRDANISSFITAIVLFWFGTSLIQGFALTFGLGVIISMFSAITVTRTFLRAIGISGRPGKMFQMGFKSKTQ